MIQGFGTREITDQILRAFVKSANGVMHEKQKVVGQYEQTIWPTFKEVDTPVAVFGCLRGTEAVIDEAGQKTGEVKITTGKISFHVLGNTENKGSGFIGKASNIKNKQQIKIHLCNNIYTSMT